MVVGGGGVIMGTRLFPLICIIMSYLLHYMTTPSSPRPSSVSAMWSVAEISMQRKSNPNYLDI